MTALETMAKLYVETPLIFSAALSQQIDRPVYLKLENTQPTGSFKLRGKDIPVVEATQRLSKRTRAC